MGLSGGIRGACLVLAMMAAAALPSGVRAQADDPCRNPLDLPTVEVVSDARAERTSAKFTAKELRDFADRNDPLPGGYRHFGFLEMDRRIRAQVRVRSGTDAYKNFCYSPQTITVTVSIAPTVYVPGEYPRTSCPAGAVRLHQLQHLDIEEQAFRELPSRIRQALHRERDLRITRKARDKQQATKLTRALVVAVAERAARELDSDMRVRHLELNSPRNYRANLSICGTVEWAGLMD